MHGFFRDDNSRETDKFVLQAPGEPENENDLNEALLAEAFRLPEKTVLQGHCED